MRILVLGGTSFVGRAIVGQALRDGTEVTLFGRGRTGTGLFPAVPSRPCRAARAEPPVAAGWPCRAGPSSRSR